MSTAPVNTPVYTATAPRRSKRIRARMQQEDSATLPPNARAKTVDNTKSTDAPVQVVTILQPVPSTDTRPQSPQYDPCSPVYSPGQLAMDRRLTPTPDIFIPSPEYHPYSPESSPVPIADAHATSPQYQPYSPESSPVPFRARGEAGRSRVYFDAQGREVIDLSYDSD